MLIFDRPRDFKGYVDLLHWDQGSVIDRSGCGELNLCTTLTGTEESLTEEDGLDGHNEKQQNQKTQGACHFLVIVFISSGFISHWY